MNNIRRLFARTPLLAAGLLVLSFFAAGCEFEGLSSAEGMDDSVISVAALNGETPNPQPVPAAVPEADEGESTSETTTTTTREIPVTAPVPVSAPAPAPAPAPPVATSPSSYAPGRVVIPAEFLAHGAMTELRFQHCSVANGLMVKLSSTVYSIAPPTHEIWLRTSGTAIGTKAKFADGAVFDGYVHDYRASYSMPIQSVGATSGRAFWVRMK
ncbi:MAG TPA: hypothetical protein DCM68_00950 [Verrucomicrobia bacterium]|nr:hypothetical protein [Verrucomicrobiota bacterium]